MLTPELISFLSSAAGSSLLNEAASLPADELSRITHLRKTHPADRVAAAIETLDLRARARAKFIQADDMFFTREGLEQSSSGPVARWRASRFQAGTVILDLCCGIGGDTMALSSRGTVFGVDASHVNAACAAANLKAAGFPAFIACADVTRIRLKGDAAFFDPSRRRTGRRVKSGEDYSPSLGFVRDILQHVPNLAVKVSPALDDETLVGLGARIEFVSHRGECKEAVLWYGGMGPAAARSASIVDLGQTLASRFGAPVPKRSEPSDWLFEPDPAVIRAHLIAEIAEDLHANQLDPMIAYLTAELPAESPFGTWYRTVEWLPFSLKRLQDRVRALHGNVTAIKKRGVPFEPEEIARRIKRCGDRPLVLVMTRVAGEVAAIICEPPSRG